VCYWVAAAAVDFSNPTASAHSPYGKWATRTDLLLDERLAHRGRIGEDAAADM
jgi:hypothetical protein